MIRIAAIGEVVLIIATWDLWRATSDFPVVPLLPVPSSTVMSAICAVVLMMSSCVLGVVRPGTLAAARAVVVSIVAGMMCVVLNQHCLQPWHWLFLVLMTIVRFFPPRVAASLIVQVLSSMYVCAALSRITTQWQSSMSWQLLDAALRMLGAADETNFEARVAMCWVMTLVELLAGAMLVFPRTRRTGIVVAIAVHVILIVLLSPLGLNHEVAVLIWNAVLGSMLVAVWRCDVGTGTPDIESGCDASGSAGASPSRFAPVRCAPSRSKLRSRLAVATIWALPASGLFGVFDNWPSWQVYSSRPERWTLLVHVDDVDLLTEPIRSMVNPSAVFGDWIPVPLDRWSLESTGSPMYPEDRFQRAVIQHVLDASDPELRFRVEISEPKTPDWWNRTHREIDGRDDVD